MRNLKRIAMTVALAPLIMFGSLESKAQPHVHGKGTLFIAQDNSLWQLQFTLPASDIFGFEHRPETEEQKAEVVQRTAKLKNVENLISFSKTCRLVDHQVEIPDEFNVTGINEHNHHKADKHNHHGHNKHDDHGHEKEHDHTDVEIVSTFDCAKALTQIELTIFNSFSSLKTLEALWATNSGQGKLEVSATSPTVAL
ncbi:DUF2796 domain-containing protein [Aliiglaciecola sp. M165]|uniref:ZrgA family zinc uptake protein n=1 Tax=Aliiglaciecola sp. M165 TaxID=2593649 RepID=UPI00163DB21D|nr:DUF2796 domain-containing protein [Aliiglaciecola sp. M165]